jgi:methanogenic corrinoid protein MtbC1
VRAVIARTGLTADVLRAWERRYGAVRPRRSPGGQRRYSEEDVARLGLMRRATLGGHSIAGIARLDLPALEALVLEPPAMPDGAPPEAADALVAALLAATERLDAEGLEAVLKRGVFALGGAALVDHVVGRFLREVGARWQHGTLSPAHEHLASAIVRRVLAWITEAYVAGAEAPCLVVATPAGELHELGAMLVAAAAAEEGWRVVYLGASLPAAHVADAAAQVGARAVALSAVHADRPALHELGAVARALPHGVALLAGGAAAGRHGEVLRDAGVRVLPDIPALRRALRALRTAGAADLLADVRGA